MPVRKVIAKTVGISTASVAFLECYRCANVQLTIIILADACRVSFRDLEVVSSIKGKTVPQIANIVLLALAVSWLAQLILCVAYRLSSVMEAASFSRLS